jgi:hypothetical protein
VDEDEPDPEGVDDDEPVEGAVPELFPDDVVVAVPEVPEPSEDEDEDVDEELPSEETDPPEPASRVVEAVVDELVEEAPDPRESVR